MNDISKNNRIGAARAATLSRHADMKCVTREIKVDASKLSSFQKDTINALFREAKWFRNYALSDINSADDKIKVLSIKVGDNFEERNLTILGSQVKQSVITEIKSSLKSLNKAKKRGRKVGALKFKSVCNCVTLKQYGTTYRIDKENKTISIQNIKKPIKVNGLKQIPDDAELANAKFVRKASGLYFYITYYVDKEEHILTNQDCGIDFGIKTNITSSDGNKRNVLVEENKGIKLASRRLNKALEHSNKNAKNHCKRKKKLKVAYEKNSNRKKDKANKLVSMISHNYDNIVIQDEMISNWQSGLFGKQVQHSAMGMIKAKLKNNSRTLVIERNFPSTQLCPVCGCLTKHPLTAREYNCAHCGYHHDNRDVKAAQTILMEGYRRMNA